MNLLIPVTVVIVSITVAIVSGRSASLPQHHEKKQPDSQDNVILLEPVTNSRRSSRTKKAKVEGDKFLLKGKNFTNLKEMVNILEEDKLGRSDQGGTPEPFSLVVPVARNFSSLKELFEILREGDAKPHKGGGTNQTYVKGTEVNSTDYLIFFTER